MPPERASDAHEGDRDSLVPLTAAPSDSDGRRHQAPAPDQGEDGGHPPDHAYRRDDSTLRSHLTDGATEAQTSRTRTAGRPASPQAIRREPVVGIGDSVRTRDAAPRPGAVRRRPRSRSAAPPAAARRAPRPIRLPPARRRCPSRRPSSRRWRHRCARPGRSTPSRARAASTTSATAGPPTDDTLRAASNELHPGLTDFNRPASPAAIAANEGRGPGASAGAVARPASGTAPSELGAPDRAASAADLDRARPRPPLRALPARNPAAREQHGSRIPASRSHSAWSKG